MAKRRIPEVLTPEEQEKFLKTFNKKAKTGLRNYIMNLKTKAVDFQTSKVHVKQGEGYKDRKESIQRVNICLLP